MGVDLIQQGRVHVIEELVFDYDRTNEYITVIKTGEFFDYRGTGNEFSTMDAELVYEEILEDSTLPNGNVVKKAKLGFKLPDVNQYLLADYSYFYGIDPASSDLPETVESLTVSKFLPRL